MPLKDNIVICINHFDVPMSRAPGYSSLPQIRSSNDAEVMVSQALPMLVFYCEICGYVESYIGPKTGYWDVDHPTASQQNPKQFESVAFDALRKAASPLGISHLDKNVGLRFSDGQIVEYDILANTENGVVIFEVKSTASKRHLESGIANLSRLMTLYGQHFPMQKVYAGFLVVPETTDQIENRFGFPVLRVDPKTATIVNLEEIQKMYPNWKIRI